MKNYNIKNDLSQFVVKITNDEELEVIDKFFEYDHMFLKERLERYPSPIYLWLGGLKNNRPSWSTGVYHFEQGKTEISFQEFMRDNKIIGYKAPFDLFKGRIKKGELFTELSRNRMVMYNKNHMTSGVPTELVKTWEPVMAEDINIGDWVIDKEYGTIGRIVDVEDMIGADVINKRREYYRANFYFGITNQDIVAATQEEIEGHLIKVVKERGFVWGESVENVRALNKEDDRFTNNHKICHKVSSVASGYHYSLENDTLYSWDLNKWKISILYSKGKWAKLSNKVVTFFLNSDTGGFNLEVNKDGIRYPFEEKWLDVNALRRIIQRSNYMLPTYDSLKGTKMDKYDVTFDQVNIGCKRNISIKDLEKVLLKYDELNE